MLDPRPSLLHSNERRDYVLRKAEQLVEKWNCLPPKQYDKDKILFYLRKRSRYLREDKKIILAESPMSIFSSCHGLPSWSGSIWSRIKRALQGPVANSLGLSLWDRLYQLVYALLDEAIWKFLRASVVVSEDAWDYHGFIFFHICYQFNEDCSIKNFAQYLPEAYKEAGLGFLMTTNREVCGLPFPKYNVDERNRLHQDLSPALVWPDGSKKWYLHGVRVSQKIAETPAEKLDSQLLLEVRNVEVRREIINKIGWGRILQKLGAKKLDSWREYVLYYIEDIDVEPAHILKMSCPSSDAYYTLRVPPDIKRARQAIRWANNNVDSKDFLVET